MNQTTLNKNNVPKHIAIIMDGNGRWAKKQSKLRMFGHKIGVQAVKETVEKAADLGVQFLTLYAFSSENWNRPVIEINALMELLINTIHKETKTLIENNIKLKAIGDIDSLPKRCRTNLQDAIDKTSNNTQMTLVLALSYGSREEIVNATKRICKKVSEGEISIDDINDKIFNENLYTNNIPDPELLIRTSGEYRISNFLLWQIAYSELYFVDVLWPDFRETHLVQAINDYLKRERRFGKTSEQIEQESTI